MRITLSWRERITRFKSSVKPTRKRVGFRDPRRHQKEENGEAGRSEPVRHTERERERERTRRAFADTAAVGKTKTNKK